MQERVRGNLKALHAMLDADEQGLVSVLRAEGGWNVLLRVPSVLDENELVLHMIERHGVSGQPGYFFAHDLQRLSGHLTIARTGRFPA